MLDKWCSSPQEGGESLKKSSWDGYEIEIGSYESSSMHMGQDTTWSVLWTHRSAISYTSLFSCHLKNAQQSVNAIVPPMPSTDLIRTQDRQPNHEINSLSACDWGRTTASNALIRPSWLMTVLFKCIRSRVTERCYNTCGKEEFLVSFIPTNICSLSLQAGGRLDFDLWLLQSAGQGVLAVASLVCERRCVNALCME